MLAPTCNYRCPEKGGTCFPEPCKLYGKPSEIEAARWRLDQCRKTVREGEEELRRRRAALEQAQIAYAEVTGRSADAGTRPPHTEESQR